MNICRLQGSPVEISKILFVTHARGPTLRALTLIQSQKPNDIVCIALPTKMCTLFWAGRFGQSVRSSVKDEQSHRPMLLDWTKLISLAAAISLIDANQKVSNLPESAGKPLVTLPGEKKWKSKWIKQSTTPEIIGSGGTYFCSFTQLLTFSTTSSLSLCNRSPLARASSSDTRRVCT